MIPSYQEEIRIRKNKDRIFWSIVAIMTIFLYFFFQGYYPNYERFLDRTDNSKQAFLKPFGIIDIHVFPSPDGIWVNDEYYSNNSKTIFDLGNYAVSIQKKGYLTIDFLLDITKKNPFYTNVVNLFALPEYSALPISFQNLSLFNNTFLIKNGTGGYLFADSDFKIIDGIKTLHNFIGGSYFTDGVNILSYSLETASFLPVMDTKKGIPLQCSNVSYYNEKLFCHDTMEFVGPQISDILEKILAINNSIIVTPQYIYNQDNSNQSWKYFEYQTGAVHLPEAVVHINKIPYIFESGSLMPLDISKISSSVISSDWGIEKISQVQEFNGETILLGENDGKIKFRIIDSEKEYAGVFDFNQTGDIKIYKISGAYVFVTPKSVYIYYKGAKEIIKILNDVVVIRMIDSKIFFNKDEKSYVLDLLRKVAQK